MIIEIIKHWHGFQKKKNRMRDAHLFFFTNTNLFQTKKKGNWMDLLEIIQDSIYWSEEWCEDIKKLNVFFYNKDSKKKWVKWLLRTMNMMFIFMKRENLMVHISMIRHGKKLITLLDPTAKCPIRIRDSCHLTKN